MTSHFAKKLDGSCWNTFMNGKYQTVSFHLVPTFYHEGGILQLKYFDQCDRDGPQVVYQNGQNGITMKFTLNRIYLGFYDGSNTIIWKCDDGTVIQWSLTSCGPFELA